MGKVNRMEQAKVQNLALTAARSRLLALDMVYGAASGHIGGSLSSLDILTTLYFHVMRVNPDAPQAPERDRFVLSKGHCTPALYSTMAQRGFFPLEELKQFRRIEGHMSGHAEMRHVKGVDMSTGSLGQGISAAVGMALAGKADGRDYRVYALLGDGEIEEGQVWEAAMAAAKYRLDNLCRWIRSLRPSTGTSSVWTATTTPPWRRRLLPPRPARESPRCSWPGR